MNRYLDADEGLIDIFLEVLHNDFPGLTHLKFALMFDTKKRMRNGKIILASTELANEKIRFFSSNDEAPEGYDYLIIVNSVAWEYASPEDRKRIISHELNHVFIDEKGRCKLVDHDVEDFVAEIEKNKDNPNWAQDLAYLVDSIYQQEK